MANMFPFMFAIFKQFEVLLIIKTLLSTQSLIKTIPDCIDVNQLMVNGLHYFTTLSALKVL